jgi:glycosyltransferase involved in cell wall biosynthesis
MGNTGRKRLRADVRVLHILNSATGGAARSSLDIIRQLRQKFGVTHQAIVCHEAGTEEDRQALIAETEGKTVFCHLSWWNRKTGTPAWKRPAASLLQHVRTAWGFGSARRVARIAAAMNADLIHSNSFTINDGCKASRWLGIPHVWHLRELIGRDAPFVFPLEGAALGAYVEANSEAVIANSTVAAKRLAPFVRAGFMRVIPNGVDVESFMRARDRAGTPPDAPVVVGMVANLTSRMKNHELFMRAASIVPANERVEFRIYGYERSDGGRRDAYVQNLRGLAAQPSLRERFRFMGYGLEPVSIMQEIDVLVHPCDVESFGRVVLEAMAAGLPVVSVTEGGVTDLVVDGTTGFLVDKNDPEAMARRISELARDRQLRVRLGKAGMSRAEEKFSLSVTAKDVLSVYEDVCSRFPRGMAPERKTRAEVA